MDLGNDSYNGPPIFDKEIEDFLNLDNGKSNNFLVSYNESRV